MPRRSTESIIGVRTEFDGSELSAGAARISKTLDDIDREASRALSSAGNATRGVDKAVGASDSSAKGLLGTVTSLHPALLAVATAATAVVSAWAGVKIGKAAFNDVREAIGELDEQVAKIQRTSIQASVSPEFVQVYREAARSVERNVGRIDRALIILSRRLASAQSGGH